MIASFKGCLFFGSNGLPLHGREAQVYLFLHLTGYRYMIASLIAIFSAANRVKIHGRNARRYVLYFLLPRYLHIITILESTSFTFLTGNGLPPHNNNVQWYLFLC